MDAENAATILEAEATKMDSLNCREPLQTLRAMALADVARGFASKTSPDGQPWAPRKDSKPHPLLVEFGALVGAATGRNAGVAAGQEFNSQQVGIDDEAAPYGGFHQGGTRKMAARPFMGMTEPTIDEGAEVLADFYLKEIFKT